MTPLRRKWGIYLCRCSLPDGFSPATLEADGATVELAAGPEALPEFAQRLRAAFAQQVVFACECTEPEQLEAACEAVGIAPEVHPLALRSATLAVHPPDACAEKALRLVWGLVAGLDARPAVAQNLLAVGRRVALFADRPEGLDLARRLAAESTLAVFLEGEPERYDAPVRGINWGSPQALSGRLGSLAVQVAPQAAAGSADAGATQRIEADQVVVLGARARDLPNRTGVHRVPEPSPTDLERIAGEVAALTGTFSKPEHVRYDSAICAGGEAEVQTCGRCIPACPYDAIARDAAAPLRVRVDHLACEGCGACASACPTSALSFTEPAPEELYARLSALLGAALGTPGGPAPAVVFHCEQQGRQLLDWAAETQAAYPARLLPVEVPCLRYVSEAGMLAAIRLGAAGVGLLGCEDCPNGERALLLGKLALTQQVLDAFGLGAERVRLLTVEETRREDALQALRTFGESLGEAPVPANGRRMHATGNREVLADAIGSLIEATGREVGGLSLDKSLPFALADVRAEGCTLCRACVTVCPTHAFAFDSDEQRLSFKHIACVNCGLCERVCPERVITLRPELYLEREGLDYVTVAQDEWVHCVRCDKPFINRRALEAVEAKLQAATGMADAFGGQRKDLLRMCPDCRGVAAMLEVEQGWKP